MKEEFSIMPDNPPFWRNKRVYESERHEVFEGYATKNRKYSIEDGLVIFLTPEQHREGKYSIHKNPKYWRDEMKIQEVAEQAWIDYYNKTKEDFRLRYGKNFL